MNRPQEPRASMATKTSKIKTTVLTKTQDEAKSKTGSTRQTKPRESLPNVRKKSTNTLHEDGFVKRRHLSVVEDNRQSRKGSVDGEKAKNGPKDGNRADKENQRNQRHKSAKEKNQSKSIKEKPARFLSASDSLIKQRKSIEKSRSGNGKSNKTDDAKENIPSCEVSNVSEAFEAILAEGEISGVEVVSPAEFSLSLPEGILNIDLDDGMFEYSAEIVGYLKEREEIFVLSNNFLEKNLVTDSMRSILVDWLIQVHHYFKFSQECLYLTIAMVDHVLDKRDVDPDKLQLVGATALWIASKAEEYYPAQLSKLIHLTEDSYKQHHVIQMEGIMLNILHFNVYFPDPMVFLLRYARAALRSHDATFQETCQFLMDTMYESSAYSSTLPSLRAAASVLGSLHLFSAVVVEEGYECWTDTLVHYTGYRGEDVAAVAVAMLQEVAKAVENDEYKYRGAYNKFQSNSQHNRLVLQPHLSLQVVRKAIRNVSTGII